MCFSKIIFFCNYIIIILIIGITVQVEVVTQITNKY